jgi:precorrin-6A/cobalt-precorrin-6A reductase
MILLIGGTSETALLAAGLADAGYDVLVSTATDSRLDVGNHPRICRRAGRLDESGMIALVKEREIRAIVDAAHPYAVSVHAAAGRAAKCLGIPCLVFGRPESPVQEGDIRFAANHAAAAELAFADGRPILLTTGSRNLAPYAEAARRTGIPLAVRVLDAPESLAACRASAIPEERIIADRGPFSLAENLAAIRRFEIGVIVTKESGRAGGFEAKLAAAREANCLLIVLRRPETASSDPTFDDPDTLIATMKELIPI